MAGDRARITYFPPRKYREVVSLQGRVLLEADSNEGQRIFTEEVRHHAFDFVGPSGTPDDGYKVTALPTDFQIGPGTMYVGGLRTTLEQAINYSSQPDWLDTALSQPWTDNLWLPVGALVKSNSHVILVLREQEITAVEDHALREVALGGPDTAARTRLLQRIVAAPTKAGTCAQAAAEMTAFWSSRGLIYDPATATLKSRARLTVTLVTDPPAPSPCDPPSASGYLGADNQLIRVQVVAFDNATGKGKLLWGLNNASTLYRSQAVDPTTVELASRPVSAEFQPRAGNVVQLLFSAADLGEGAFAAAITGHRAKLTAPYNPDTRRVTLPNPMPVIFQAPSASPLFLRLWEDELDFDLNTPVTLTGTGLQVSISLSNPGMLHLGDHWSIGVRPLTPNAVYPERYLTSAQPPDGPRMWACPLAVLLGNGKTLAVGDDCRLPFDNLVELTARKTGDSCACTVCVSAEAHNSGKLPLQTAIDNVIKVGGGTICLEVGAYRLREPLRVTKARGLHMVGKGVASELFGELGGIEIHDSIDVTLESFRIVCQGNKSGSGVLLHSSSGIRVERLDIENQNSGGAAVIVSGALANVVVRDNVFKATDGLIDILDPKIGATGVLDLRIEENQFVCQSAGIKLASIHQHRTLIAGNTVSGCEDAGFVLTGATVPGFGIEVVGNELAMLNVGIVAGIDGIRIVDNDLTSHKPPTQAEKAIVLTKGFIDSRLENRQIVGNRIRDFKIGISGEVPMRSVNIARNQITTVEHGIVIGKPVDDLIVEHNQLSAVTTALQVQGEGARVSVLGNQLEITTGSPGVSITCPGGNCVYTNNISTHVKTPPTDGVLLSRGTLMVTSNRILGRAQMNLDTSPKVCTVLGNITGAEIILAGVVLALGNPWFPLNHQGV
jgi:hypothetical protein